MDRQQRIALIKSTQPSFWAGTKERVLRNPEEHHAYSEIIARAASESRGQPEIARKARRLEEFALAFPASIDPGQLIAGSRRFGYPYRPSQIAAEQFKALDIRGNHGHIIIDYGALLRDGIPRRLADASVIRHFSGERQRFNQAVFARAMAAFKTYVERHSANAAGQSRAAVNAGRRAELESIAANCRVLLAGPPKSFAQALQLLWFAHTFIFAEGFSSAFSFGRFDQFMWPYLRDDLEAGRLTREEAKDWLSCFWLKCCEGCESQNLTLGGVDAQGMLAENPLTFLCLEVAAELRTNQPSLSVRLCPQSSEAFWQAALRLGAQGDGQPSFVNDTPAIAGLLSLGVSLGRARDWGVVGCYEPSTQGDCGAFTVAGNLSLPAVFREFFDQESEYPDFPAYLGGFMSHLRQSFPVWLQGWEKSWQGMAGLASPFESLCVTGCLESGLAVEEGGARHTFFGINTLGFGTLVDSLIALKQLAYDERRFSLAELRQMVKDDFPSEAEYLYCRSIAARYGSAHQDSNRLAAELSRELGKLFAGVSLGGVARLSPGLFLFSADIMRQDIPATPDGRRKGEPCSYGVGPFAAGGVLAPTQVLASAASVDHALFPGGNPLMLSFSRADLEDGRGIAALRGLVGNYFKQGGFQLQFNAVDAKELRQAKLEPAKFNHLLVRVSGYSAKFTAVDSHWQDVLIQRAEQGL